MELEKLKEFWSGFPEAPFSDTFKWVDNAHYEHMMTIRGWDGTAVIDAIAKAQIKIVELGGRPVNTQPKSQIQEHTEDGTPVVDGDGKPVMTDLPEGTAVYTVKAVSHGQNKDKNKDILKVFTEEKASFVGKYGINCFHPPEQYRDFTTWPIDTPVAPKDGAKHVIIRAPKGDDKYGQVLEFRV